MKQGKYLGAQFIFLIILFVSGCATTTIQTASIDTSKPFNRNSGIVAVQVVNNTDRLSKFIDNWTEVVVTRVDNIEELKQQARDKLKAEGETIPEDKNLEWDPDIYTLMSRSSGLNESRIFIGELPEGEYIVSKLWSYYNDGEVSAYLSMPVGFSAGIFRVEKTRFTDLGTLLFQPLLNIKKKSFWSPQPGSRAYVARSSTNLELGQLVKQVYPKLKGSVNFNNPLTWKADNLDSFRIKVADLSYENLYGNRFVPFSHHGKVVQLTRLGRVRILNKNDHWSQLTLPTQAQLLTAIDTPDQIAFAGERGLLLTSNSINGDWKISQPVNPDHSIKWLGKIDEQFVAMTVNGNKYNIYKFDNFDSNWQLIKTHIQKSSFFSVTGGVFPVITANRTLRLFINDKIWDYDSVMGVWSSTNGNKLVRLSQLSGTNLSALEISSWDGIGDQAVSFDSGLSWIIINRNLNSTAREDRRADASLAAITTQGKLITVGRPPMENISFDDRASIKKNTNPLKIIAIDKSQVQKKNEWAYLGDLKEDCATIVPELSMDERIYMLCDKGQIVYTKDNGKSWQTDISIDIASMQQSFDALLLELKSAEELKKADRE